ncbi:MAG: type II toxin-antitoxin system Phd/YefM family antitoxin [Chloroflexota bacterium]
MKIAPVAEVKAKFSAYLKDSEKGPVIVTRNGKAVAVLLSVESDDEVERLVLANSGRFQSILDVARKQIREGKGIPHEEFWREVQSGGRRRPATR